MNLTDKYFSTYGEGPEPEGILDITRDPSIQSPAGADDPELLKKIFGLLDLTTLNTDDNHLTALKFAGNLNAFPDRFPGMPSVAAVCVYPALVEDLRRNLTAPGVKIAAVGAGFPSSQTFLAVKVAECGLTVSKGADEIDVVISVGRFLAGEHLEVLNELVLIREACAGARLKVILETGLLKDTRLIRLASLLALESGADFIKTSTGKVAVSATPEAVTSMCLAIRDYHSATGRMAGIKPAGGIQETTDALRYYRLVGNLLGEPWLNPEWFRIGASRLANNLLTAVTGSDIRYF